MEKFSFDGALMHFARTRAPGTFLWKFVLAVLVLYGLATLVLWFIAGPTFVEIIRLSMEDPNMQMGDDEALAFLGRMGLAYLVAIPLFVVAWSVLEGAVQRRYVRLEGFSVRFGSDELRLIAVALLWMVLFIGLYLAAALAIGIPIGLVAFAASSGGGGGEVVAILMGVVLGLAALCFVLFILVRLSPAAALTIRDRKITFFGAWGATRGRFWPLFGAFALTMIILGIAGQVVQTVGMMSMGGLFLANADALEAGDFAPVLMSPVFITMVGVFFGVYMALQAISQYVVAGIPAHAANTDPRGGNAIGTVETFA